MWKYFLLFSFVFCTSEKIDFKKIEAKEVLRIQKNFQESKKNLDTHVYFFGNVQGETKDCGCAKNPKGGLKRRHAFATKKSLKQEKFVFDTGSSLFKTPVLSSHDEKESINTALRLFEEHKKMGVKYKNIAEFDLSAGLMFLEELQRKNPSVSFLSSNLSMNNGKEIWKKSNLVEHLGKKFLILSFANLQSIQIKGLKEAEISQSLVNGLLAEKNFDFIFVLSELTSFNNFKLGSLLEKSNRPYAILGSKEIYSMEKPITKKSGIYWTGMDRGQSWEHFSFSSKNKHTFWMDEKTFSESLQALKRIETEKLSLEKHQEKKSYQSEVDHLESDEKDLFNKLGNPQSYLFYEPQAVIMDEKWGSLE